MRALRTPAALALAFCALALPTAPAQEAKPPAPAGPASPAPPRLPVFPGGVEQVVVDVVVLDAGGHPVTGLTQEDFTLTEENAARPVLSFEAVAPADDAATATGNPAAQAPLTRVFALVFDDLHLTVGAGDRVKQAMKDMVGSVLRDSDEVVLLSTGSGQAWAGRLGQQRAELLAALDRLRGQHSPPRACEMTDEEALQIHLEHDLGVQQLVFERFVNCGLLSRQVDPLADSRSPDRTTSVPGQSRNPRQDVPGLSMLASWATDQHEDAARRIRATYTALEHLLRALAPVRGRKTVVLGSEGFVRDRGLTEVKNVAVAAGDTNAAVYFLDARDLAPRALAASGDAHHAAGTSELGRLQQGRFFGAEASEQLALETGGTSIRGGELTSGLRRLAEESRSYYLLGYTPANPALDGGFRRIEVTVGRPGLTVRARRGYYAVARPGPAPANVAIAAVTAAAVPAAPALPAVPVAPNPDAMSVYLRPPTQAAAEVARWSPDQLQRALAALKAGSAGDDVLEAAALAHAAAALTGPPSLAQARVAVQAASLLEDAGRRRALDARVSLGLAHGFLEARDWETAQDLTEQASNRLGGDADVLLAFGIVQETTGSVVDGGHRPNPDQTILTSGFDEMVSRNPVTGFAAGVPGGPVAGQPRFESRMTRKGAPTSEARLRRAAESYRRALKVQPDLAEARLRLGRTLALLGDKEAAQELSTAAAAGSPADVPYLAHLFLGDAREQAGDYTGAAAQYRAAQAARPASTVARLALARALHAAGARADAAEGIQKLLLEPPAAAARDPWWSYRLRPLGRWADTLGAPAPTNR